MEPCITLGIRFYPDYRHPLAVDPDDAMREAEPMGASYRFILLAEGTGSLQIGGRSRPILAPAAIFLNETESFRLTATSPCRAKSVLFHPMTVNRLFDPLPLAEPENGWSDTELQDLWCLRPFRHRSETEDGYLQLDPSYAKHFLEIVDEIGEQLTVQPDVSWPCRSRSLLLELLHLGRRLCERAAGDPERVRAENAGSIEPILRYLHTHYRQRVRLEDVTRAFHTNKTTLNNQFKAHLGLTVTGYLNLIRMQMAASMLRNTTLPASEIMEKVGIRDSAHFIRSFRKTSGCSPAEYRARFCWMRK